jgi:isoleucyl-tRNA synthetase
MAPVLAFTAEETWSFMSDALKSASSPNNQSGVPELAESVHLCNWPRLELALCESEIASVVATFERVFYAREYVTKALEDARVQGLVGKSQEAVVHIAASADLISALENLGAAELEELLIVAKVELLLDQSAQEPSVTITSSTLDKCPRCWNYRELSEFACTHSEDKLELCSRCTEVLNEIGWTC